MNISCNIIRDLLPLYAEDLASPESRELVGNHLCRCQDCTREYEALKAPAPIPAEAESQSLAHIKKSIRRRWRLSVLAAVLTVLSILSLTASWLFAGVLLRSDQAIHSMVSGTITPGQAQYLAVLSYPGITGRATVTLDGDNLMFLYTSTRYDYYFRQDKAAVTDHIDGAYLGQEGTHITVTDQAGYHSMELLTGQWRSPKGNLWYNPPTEIFTQEGWVREREATEFSYWYPNPYTGQPEKLLWGSGMPDSTAGFGWSRGYARAFAMALTLALLFWAIPPLRRGRYTAPLAHLFTWAAFSILFVSGGRLLSCWGNATARWPEFILSNTALLTAASLTLHKIRLLHKGDQAL